MKLSHPVAAHPTRVPVPTGSPRRLLIHLTLLLVVVLGLGVLLRFESGREARRESPHRPGLHSTQASLTGGRPLTVTALATGMTGGMAATPDPAPAQTLPSGSQTVLRILAITPAGEDVPPGRQIVLQFDRAVVPVGRMEREAEEIPVTVEPALDCEWRWLNTSALACQLSEEDALDPATRYRLRVGPGLVAQDGSTLAGEHRHEFLTHRPAVTRTYFDTWTSPGRPQIYVYMNQRVEAESVARHLYFAVPGQERRAVVILPQSRGFAQHTFLVAPERDLPSDVQVQLRVEPGLVPLDGVERGVHPRTVLEIHTFPPPRFLGVRCHTVRGDELFVRAEGGPTHGKCNPLRPVSLVFASPIVKEVLRDHLGVNPDLAAGRRDYDPWDHLYSHSRLRQPRRADQLYTVRLPETLKARTRYHLTGRGRDLQDEFGRPLPQDVDFTFHTDDRPPNLVLTHSVSVLERHVDTALPVVVTNLEALAVRFQRLTLDGTSRDEVALPVPRAPNVAFPLPLRVRDWLGGGSGIVYGSIAPHPRPPGRGDPWFFSQVTPFHVHAKLGHESSLVWVTRMATGQPVAGARVTLYSGRLPELAATTEVLSEGQTGASGIAVMAGNRSVDPDLKATQWLHPSRGQVTLFVRVEQGGEMALLPLAQPFQLPSRGLNDLWIPSDRRRRFGHIRTWGTTAQGVYRVGQTVQYKIYVRDQDDFRLTAAPDKTYTLRVIDPMGKVVHEARDQELNGFGSLHGEFVLATNGAVGWHQFELEADFSSRVWCPMRVLVADFTPAPFRVRTELSGDLYRPGDDLEVHTTAHLHSGGAYGEAQSRVTVTLRAAALKPVPPKAQGFFFEAHADEPRTLHQSEGSLDSQGELSTRVPMQPSDLVAGTLVVESAVRDDRGKYVTHRARARYAGRDRFVGIRQRGWLLEAGQPTEVLSLVLDDGHEVRSGETITTVVEYRETEAARVKGAGNAYLTRYRHTWVEVARCQTLSREDPTSCGFTPQRPGRYRMTASVTDTRGRSHSSSLLRWSQGRGQVIWEVPPGHLLPIEAEKAEYRVGERARFLIRNPFPGARALLTLERIGVQRSWTRVLETASEVVEVEVTADHLPGFYLSCIVMSPRVAGPPAGEPAGATTRVAKPDPPPATGEIDLGKPALRMGYVRVPVRDPYKEIQVTVVPQATTYRPRQRAVVDLEARPTHLRAGEERELPAMELAVAVLDEAVFDLLSQGRDTFDPYRGFYDLEPLDLENFNLLTRLVGIQSFEKKGANAGGGGAAGPQLRSRFELVSYWNPSLFTDSRGRARIEIELPDNLTGWRVLAMATTAGDRMGLGEGSFVVNQPIELRPALPNQVLEGDRFTARFTVMNRTPRRRTLTLDAKVEGPARSAGLAALSLEAEPYKAYPVSFPVEAMDDGEVHLTVEARSGRDGDALRLPLQVGKRVAVQTAATYGTTLSARVTEPIAFPEDIRTDVGRVSVVASPSVIGGTEGAFRYLQSYPYLCWEQRLTKGVMASHFSQLRDYLPPDLAWPGHETLPQRTLDSAASFQAPNGGMVYWIPEDRYASPYLSAYTALAFQWLRRRGHAVPVPVEARLHTYLKRHLRSDAFPDFYTRGMASSVRAVALAALAPSGGIDVSDLERYRRHVLDMDLFGKAHYLLAAAELGAPGALRDEVRQAILAHSNQTGGKLVFTESVDVGFQRILHSNAKSHCAILTALVRDQGPAPTAGTGVGDIPFKLTRTITQERKRRDRWENTQENVFCMNALVDFHEAYEADTPGMTIEVGVDGESLGSARFDALRDPPVELSRALRPQDPGTTARVQIDRRGTGRLYYSTRLFYSPTELAASPLHAGMEIRREYSVERQGRWELLASPLRLERGELVRVDLYVSLPAARNFVVVDDPVPGGLEPVNRQLATASEVDADKGGFQGSAAAYWFQFRDWCAFASSRWSFYHRELRHDSARFYSDYLPAGRYHLSYVAQAIAPGEFQVLPVKAEEMYDPDVFGQGLPATLVVSEKEERP